MADSFIMCATMIGGPEFQPIKGNADGIEIDEKRELRMAFSDYCEAKQIGDFPPGIALTIAMLAYIGPRFTMPNTQKRSKRFFTWLGAKWALWRNRRAAHADNRNDGKRKDDARETASETATSERP